MAVIAAHPVDLIALSRIEESFSAPPADYYFNRRKENCFLTGITPSPNNKYFNHLLLSYPVEFDLFFHFHTEKIYLVEIGSKLGENFVLKHKNIFFPTQITIKIPPIKTEKNIFSDPVKLAKIIEKSQGKKIWKELEKICLNCGICAWVCPLCYCFSINDEISSSGDACKRCRQWDSCVLPKFSQISGGYNFRPTPGDRLDNWYYHKFVRAVRERGKIDCVGCNRCIENCPAKINFRKIIKKLATKKE
ncbi:MAG: hydrogenase/sulfur reductase subunit beta [Candidatus Berkelbacteria bacterium Licking1014_7]|uniref:Hydrogenase/sulfur reductase subunit beta n=1 Tax=Candidatus Berkelbacteria bacterium Licking1014_7 TaxID=2017147 RepID=A0A554LJE9_9BACT|nr:MAG: hydrogenase/sulfur reductase subunit beta [Candidatus Berkelbacteria bacterium Licking1014_7]